jgi:hypothetical protein
MSELLAFILFDSSEAESHQIYSDVPRGIQVDNLTLYLEENCSTPVARKRWAIALWQRTQYHGYLTRWLKIRIKEPKGTFPRASYQVLEQIVLGR